ncbi:MAG: hypothetical protein ACXWJX_12375 [Limisphaerales bacterium]
MIDEEMSWKHLSVLAKAQIVAVAMAIALTLGFNYMGFHTPPKPPTHEDWWPSNRTICYVVPLLPTYGIAYVLNYQPFLQGADDPPAAMIIAETVVNSVIFLFAGTLVGVFFKWVSQILSQRGRSDEK